MNLPLTVVQPTVSGRPAIIEDSEGRIVALVPLAENATFMVTMVNNVHDLLNPPPAKENQTHV